MSNDRSVVRNERGEPVAVDVKKGQKVHRYETYKGTTTTKKLISVRKNGRDYEASGTDFLGNPVYTGKSSKVNE